MARKSDFTLPSYDSIFTTQEMRDDAKLEKIHNIKLKDLHPFKEHPFKVLSGEEMDKLIESIEKFGVLTPALARPLEGGSYELVSGHRRYAACQYLGIEEMPVIVREMSRDEAVIAMVDANLQREKILPSEKAFAYKLKLDAIKHQGVSTSRQDGEKLLSVSKVGQMLNDSERQVHRYIRLTHLIPELLSKVDKGEIAVSPAVELSFLLPSEQSKLLDQMEYYDATPSQSQAIELKKLSQLERLDNRSMNKIMSEMKANQQEHISFKADELRKYFPKNYKTKDIYDALLKLAESDYKKRQRLYYRDER